MRIEKVLVLGAGTMGQGIAQWLVQQGLSVNIYDKYIPALERAERNIPASWDKLQEKGKFTAETVSGFKKALHFHTDLGQATDQVQLVIEAVIEDLQVKADLFSQLCPLLDAEALLSTNTSGLSLAVLGRPLPAERKKRFLGLHFFNPATLMPLVEVVEGPWSPPALLQDIAQWFQERGKTPVICQDRPGFIVNRLNRSFYGEALRIAQFFSRETFQEIDQVLREVGGFKMGPFELMDLIGIDVNYSVTKNLWADYFYESRFAPHPLQKQMVESGRLGKKTGEGFYQYEA